MTFLAAWQAQDWQLANESIRQALQTVRINPVANRLLAAYLSDNHRQHNNAMLLHITKHAPELFTTENALEMLEDQIALAGRYLPPRPASCLCSKSVRLSSAVIGMTTSLWENMS